MNFDSLDYATQGMITLCVFNLLMLLCLGQAWLIGTTPKTSRLWALTVLALCGIFLYVLVNAE